MPEPRHPEAGYWLAWQRGEGALVFLAGLSLHVGFGAGMHWWMAVIWFFLPDLSFAAYGAGKRVGAAVYNLVHLYGFGAVIFAAGLWADHRFTLSLGALWLAHSGFDRMLGYGLKGQSAFEETHLGRIGRS